MIETLVQRGGDAAGGSLFAALVTTAGLGLAVIASIAAPIATLWLALSIGLVGCRNGF